jgi:hypothetical protein
MDRTAAGGPSPAPPHSPMPEATWTRTVSGRRLQGAGSRDRRVTVKPETERRSAAGGRGDISRVAGSLRSTP